MTIAGISKLLRSVNWTVSRALSRWPGWVRLTAIALVGLLGLVIVLNVALNLGRTRPFLASLISVSPQSLNVDYRRAWFVWPSVVYVRKLEVRGSDVNVQWQLEVDSARLSIDPIALFKREFHATKVRAQGVAFRLRRKIDGSAATTDRLAPLPAIQGIEGPPIIESIAEGGAKLSLIIGTFELPKTMNVHQASGIGGIRSIQHRVLDGRCVKRSDHGLICASRRICRGGVRAKIFVDTVSALISYQR